MNVTRAAIVVLTSAATVLPATPAFSGEPAPARPVAVGEAFPKLEGTFLSGRKAILPDAAAGKVALVMLGFTYKSRFAVEVWAGRFRSAWGGDPRVTLFEVPILDGAARLARWFIDGGMRSGTPKELHENVITVYGGVDRWKTVMGFARTGADDAYLALLDREGRVVWLHHGEPQEQAFAALKAAVAAAVGSTF